MTIPYAELRRKWKEDPEFGKPSWRLSGPSSNWREPSWRRGPEPG